MPGKDNLPLVSIIMPTYNRAKWIGKAIKSIKNQNYDNWELLIIDNESTDNTENIVNQFRENDGRI